MHMTSVTIDSILPRLTSHGRAALGAADIVIAVDNGSQREFTVFGTPALESTSSLKKLSAMQVARVLFDYDSQQLAELTAVVRGIKGLDARPTGKAATK